MFYSIGETAKLMGIPTTTIRYYERMGLLMDIERKNGGVRVFSDADLETLRVIDCLKASGLRIREIRDFLLWCREGDSSIEKRRQLFYERKEALLSQIESLQQTLKKIEYKCWYYDMAAADGTENRVKTMKPEEMPEEVQKWKALFSERSSC